MCAEKKMEDIVHLAELCIEVLQQNEEHHAEVSRIYARAPNPVVRFLQPIYRKCALHNQQLTGQMSCVGRAVLQCFEL